MAALETRDIVPVHSRISWGAIFAGAITAFTAFILLSVLGTALGLNLTGRVEDRTLQVGAVCWTIGSALLALFLGGWITSQYTTGEDRLEAALYGMVMWGVVFVMLLGFAGGVVRSGLNAALTVASSPAVAEMTNRLSDADLQRVGVTQEQLDQLRARAQNPTAELHKAAEYPGTQAAAWWTFAGMILSLLAAVGGAIAGAGPTLALARIGFRSTMVGQVQQPRQTANIR